MSGPSHVLPRRRPTTTTTTTTTTTASKTVKQPTTQPQSPSDPPCATPSKGMTLRKGSTFHSPTSPSSPVDDPILSVRSLPSRSLTCPRTLEELVAASEKRISDLLESFDRSFSGLTSNTNASLSDKEALPVPPFLVAHAASNADLMELDSKNGAAPKSSTKLRFEDHHHGSDSGLGSSVSTDDLDAHTARSRRSSLSSSSTSSRRSSGETSVYSALTAKHLSPSKTQGHFLNDYATKQINLHIVEPLLQESKLQEFHPLVKGIPNRISDRSITCLRDLEKTLIFLAPVSADLSRGEDILAHCFLRAKTKSSSATSYLLFCETSIQCIHTAVEHLNEIDQRRPTDRPYTNNYFVDLVEQVRAYARIMAVSRQKKAKGKKLDESDASMSVPLAIQKSPKGAVLTLVSGEKLELKGGVAEDGKPIELVRIKNDGKELPIDAGHVDIKINEEEDEDEDDTMLDDDVHRSMARKRKCDIGKVEYRSCRECGKVYTRPCDLTKHEKTHSRPWKCSQPDCKYYDLGWPTEKERDRHVNDKHSSAPPMYKCLYEPCAYQSKRESNCKQHMEKTHGWEYVRSKSKKGEKLVAVAQSPTINLMPTPASSTAFPRLSTPLTSVNDSPMSSGLDAFSPSGSSNISGHDIGNGVGSMGMGSSYSMSPLDGVNEAQNAFDFAGFEGGLNGNTAFVSPQMSAGRRASLDTSGTGLTPSSAASGMPQVTFEDTFNFNELNYNWPSMVDFFPQYSIPVGAQQPTPAWSDFDCDMTAGDSSIIHPELSPGARPDTMFGAQDGLAGGDDGFANFSSTKSGSTFGADDFELFGPNGESSAAGAAAGAAMFPDMGNASQFGHESNNSFEDDLDLDNYIYGDEH